MKLKRFATPRWTRRLVLGLLCALATTSLLKAQPDEDTACSNRSLKGYYGGSIDGQVLTGPRIGPLRGVFIASFDGKGSWMRRDFSTLNGMPVAPVWNEVKGTYALNADCTGTAELAPGDGSPLLKLRLVVVRNGKQFHAISETNAVSSVGVQRE
jgi:hypothetical protein